MVMAKMSEKHSNQENADTAQQMINSTVVGAGLVCLTIPTAMHDAELDRDNLREIFDAKLNGEYESIVFVDGASGCTGTDLGNGYGVTAAHCFYKIPGSRDTKEDQTPMAMWFDCEPDGGRNPKGTTYCDKGSLIKEVAIVKQYRDAVHMDADNIDIKRGYDLAFFKYDFRAEVESPTQHFEMHVGVDPNAPVTHMGYDAETAGLNGGECYISTSKPNKSYFIVSEDYMNAEYAIVTD